MGLEQQLKEFEASRREKNKATCKSFFAQALLGEQKLWRERRRAKRLRSVSSFRSDRSLLWLFRLLFRSHRSFPYLSSCPLIDRLIPWGSLRRHKHEDLYAAGFTLTRILRL